MRLKFVVGSVLLAILMTVVPTALHAQVTVAIGVAPPPLLVYDQPICPGDGYFWTPGYWDYDYDASDYFWVPGTWVEPPQAGFLWTPGYWGWGGSGFLFNAGYWGPVVGFYGGINYGFGYFGTGFYGGRWDHDHFFYNTSVWHVGGEFHNVYNERVDIHNDVRVSYNGHGGVEARATSQEEAAARERHVGPVAAQTQHLQAARSDPQQRFSNNHGRPATVATAKPGELHGNNAARSENNATRTENNNARTENNSSKTFTHPKDLPASERPAAPNTGNAKQDQKLQQQQQKLYSRQDQERQKLQAQQDKEHQQMQKQKASDTRTQQVEQKHAQQTQQLQQRHTQQTQQMQQRSAPSASHSGGEKPK
jgi:hypothetical protein